MIIIKNLDKKHIITFLTVSTLLAAAVPVLADTTPSTTPPADSFKTAYNTGINTLKQLQSQDKQIREQINAIRKEFKAEQINLGFNWTNTNEKSINQSLKSDRQQLNLDRKAKNVSAVQIDFGKLQGDLNNQIQADQSKLNTLSAVKDSLGNLPQLRIQANQIQSQIKTIRQDINNKLKTDRQNKNKAALTAAKADMAVVKTANINTKAISLKADLQQLKSDSQSGSVNAIKQDLANLTTDLQNQITARQSILSALQKVDSDL